MFNTLNVTTVLADRY